MGSDAAGEVSSAVWEEGWRRHGPRATVSMNADGSDSSDAAVVVVDRAAALAEGAPRIPRRVIYIAIAVAALLAGLGVLGEDYLSSAGLNPVPEKSAPSTVPATIATGVHQLDAPLAAFMGIVSLTSAPAPAFTLTDQSGKAVSLASEHGRIVILSFFDASCKDICPVVEAELAQADIDLGKAASHVVFLTINTDALRTALTRAPAAVVIARHDGVTNADLLGGSFQSLDAVWRAYGITINVSRASGIEAHTDALYFISPQGDLRFRATPYANESATGAFSLPRASIARWGSGIAAYSDELLRQPR